MVIVTLVGFFLVILFAFGILGLYIWIKRKRYPRESFAGAGVTAISTMAITAMTCIIGKVSPWGAIMIIGAKLFKIDYQPTSPDFVHYSFILVIFGIGTFAIYKIYSDWKKYNGAISVQQFNDERGNEPISMTRDGFFEIKRLVLKNPPLEIYEPLKSNDLPTALEEPTGSLAWHIQASELFVLRNPSYYFSSDEWHEQEYCWGGKNKKSEKMVFLYCTIDPPNPEQISRFCKYATDVARKKHINLSNIELIFAVKNDWPICPIEFNGSKCRVESEESLLNDLVDFQYYFDDIKKRVGKDHLADSNLTLNDVYTPSNFKIVDDDKNQKNIESFLKSWSIDPGRRQLALLGEYGQGKSTCSLLFTYHLISDSDNQSRIPILMELRGKSPRNMTTDELLATWALRYNINPKALMKLLVAGRLILILEGFDEMALIGDAEMRINHFRTLWQLCFPKSKILITGRPNFFLDDSEMKAALGIQEPRGNAAYCQALHLLPFDIKRIKKALRFLDEETRNEICNFALKDPKFMEIVSRPSLLYMVGLLWKKEQLSDIKNKLNSAYLMELFIRNSYRRQGAKIGDKPDFMALNSQEREFFMSGIAYYMASKSLPNQITKEQFHEIVSKLTEVIPDSVSSVKAITREKSIPLRKRIKDDENALEHIKTDVRACGLLVVDPTKSGAFKFAHKSFMEYLFADIMSYRLFKNKNIDDYRVESAGAISKIINVLTSNILKYQESISFLAELILNRSSKSGLRLNDSEEFIKCLYKIFVFSRRAFSGKFLFLKIVSLSRSKHEALNLILPLLIILFPPVAVIGIYTRLPVYVIITLAISIMGLVFKYSVPSLCINNFSVFLKLSNSIGIKNEEILKTFLKNPSKKMQRNIDSFIEPIENKKENY
ncbi:MAG: NACHT domain-containing protein [Candidatus Omnitrophota bacterium]